MQALHLRPARESETAALLSMQARSMRGLGRRHYDAATIEAVIRHMGTMDPTLIADGTYYVAEAAAGERIAGSAGWSRRTPNYAALMDRPPERLSGVAVPVATVRSVFVDPGCARQGVATLLMRHVEAQMEAAGIATAELMATLSGLPLYCALGYRVVAPYAVELPGGLRFAALRMTKPLAGAASLRAAAA